MVAHLCWIYVEKSSVDDFSFLFFIFSFSQTQVLSNDVANGLNITQF